MYLCVRGIDLASFHDFSIAFLELFRQCGMFWSCSDSVVCFGAVPTV